REVAEAAIRANSGADTLTLYETALLPQSELSLESAMKSYRSGEADFILLLDAERELKRMRLDYLKTVFDYRKAVASIERAVGEDLENFKERDLR
ncbi:MAG: TolC family protein, partial [Thermodesulfobacteriota bacterium]